MSQKSNILVVGQGLAGTILAHQLLQKGFEVTIIDKGHEGISSALAAGVVNPVTGRRIVKSWMIDDLLPVAKGYYQAVERELGIRLWYDLPALRLFTDTGMSNNWGIRMGNEGYERYLDFAKAEKIAQFQIKNEFGVGMIQHSARSNIFLMISTFRKKWLQEGRLKEAPFQHEDLVGTTYQGQFFDQIIFCEGWEAMHNPLFKELPFQVTKGEVFILRLPEMPEENIVKKKVAFIPLGDHLFWAGATNFWDFVGEKPSKEGKSWLKTEIEAVLSQPYEIVNHKAAIRPTVRHRRPIIGFPKGLEANKTEPKIGIFNGFGTKGTSLVPYWAAQFVKTMSSGGELNKEVDVNAIKVKKLNQ